MAAIYGRQFLLNGGADMFESKDYKKGRKEGYNKAISDVLKILNEYDADPDDMTKFSISLFKSVKSLTKYED